MSTTIFPKQTRFVTFKRYQELSGLSYATVDYLCKSGQLNYITTESGQRRIDTSDGSGDNSEILKRLERQEKMLSALCRQFNTGNV